MAQVWQALNSLSKTVGDRGGVADAMLRGADATLGLKKAEYDIARGQAADKRAAETFDMTKQEHDARMPELKQKAQEAEDQMKMVPILASEIIPGGPEELAHFLKIRKEDGKNLLDDMEGGLPGSSWNDKGARINKDGTEVMVPKWQKQKQYMPAMTILSLSRMDPEKKVQDGIFKAKENLSALAPNSPEYIAEKKKVDTLQAVLDDPKQLATLNAQKATKLHEAYAWAVANGSRPDLLNIIKADADKAEAKYEKYSKTMTKEEKAVFDADLDVKKAHAAYYKGAANKANRDPAAKTLSFTERKAMGEAAIEEFGLSRGLKRDLMTENFAGGSFSDKEADELLKDAGENGLNVYFKKNKEGKRSITGITPKAGFGRQQDVDDEDVPAKGGKAQVADKSKAGTGLKADALQDIVKAGGKVVRSKDGATHVFAKDGKYLGTTK